MTEFKQPYGAEVQCEQTVRVLRSPNGLATRVAGPRTAASSPRHAAVTEVRGLPVQGSEIVSAVLARINVSLMAWPLAMHPASNDKSNVYALELTRPDVGYRGAWLVPQMLLEIMRLPEAPRHRSGRIDTWGSQSKGGFPLRKGHKSAAPI